MERLLRYAGHEVVPVTGGAEAMAMLHVRKPELVVLDVNMPEIDGLTMLKMIKDHEESKDVRIVMIPPTLTRTPESKPLVLALWTS